MVAEAIAIAIPDSRRSRSALDAALDIFRVRQYCTSGWIHQELQRSQDGQPDIFRVLR